MQININETEAMALMKLRLMLKNAATPTPQFLEWIAARLVRNGDLDATDFIQKLREYATELSEIQDLLNIRR